MRKIRPICFLLLSISFSSRVLADDVSLKWVDTSPTISAGASWGVPWPKDAVQKDQTFDLTTADGKNLPVQNWPLAYWPDGSIKWMGFATVAGDDVNGPVKLSAGPAVQVGPSVKVQQTDSEIDIDTGTYQCHLSRSGANLFDSMTVDGRVVAKDARLECILQNGPELDPVNPPPRERYVSDVQKVTLEQTGPVRAVVKIEGMHKSVSGTREWLPFVVRLYFYAGAAPVRMVHTFVFDGDQDKDFIRGLGIVFSVPMREETQNRHVSFSGEGEGIWAEPIQPLLGYNMHANYPGGGDVYADQVAGKRMPNMKDFDARSQQFLKDVAIWDDYRLIQANAQGFTIEKRTNPQSAWVPAGSGARASGVVFAGDVSGGLAVGVQNFWQMYPDALEVRHASTDAADLRVWLWSPDSPAMDMRHYDTRAHVLNATYEDVQPGYSSATGVARTSELTLFPTNAVPTKVDLAKDEQIAVKPPILVCSPEYLHSVGAFGIWSLQDRSTPFKKAVEDQLDAEISYYQKGVDQWNWYGFWDFGDIMHSYDDVRHMWRYDVGGFAWDNDEQCTDIWLWYSFLRTGRPDIYRMAEAMTRSVAEVDCYHLGPMVGMGTRHNVRHWGDGAKEVRISQAAYRRYYYYLSTDERTGDIMREMLVADQTIAKFDPMREADPVQPGDPPFPARLRAGPDWLALIGNWMTEWERTGDTKYRGRILTGVDSIAAMPYWFRTSRNLVWGYYPDTFKLVPRDPNAGGYNLVTNMGGPEVVFELNTFLDSPTWQKIWLQYCRLDSAPAAVLKKDQTTGNEGADGQYAGGGRLAAYAYYITKNPAFGRRGLGGINSGRRFEDLVPIGAPEFFKPIDEAVGVNGVITNTVNQNSLQTIECLEMLKDQLPNDVPPQPVGGRGFGRRGGAATRAATAPGQ